MKFHDISCSIPFCVNICIASSYVNAFQLFFLFLYLHKRVIFESTNFDRSFVTTLTPKIEICFIFMFFFSFSKMSFSHLQAHMQPYIHSYMNIHIYIKNTQKSHLETMFHNQFSYQIDHHLPPCSNIPI